MAVTPSYVQVAPDSTGKRIDNTELNTGLPGGVVQRQVTSQGDPEDPDARARVRNTPASASDYGAVVRVAPQFNYDSGLLTLPAGAGVLTGTTTKVESLYLANVTEANQFVTVTDGNDKVFLPGKQIPPHDFLLLPLQGRQFVNGIKWHSGGNADAIHGQVLGVQ